MTWLARLRLRRHISTSARRQRCRIKQRLWGKALLLILATGQSVSAAPSPVGLWRSFDDRTGQVSGLIRIFEADGILHGKVVEIAVPADRGRVCERCTDDRHNQSILGMEIFRDLRPEGDGWAGHVLDPQNGSIYTCTAHLIKDGKEFVLRGYVLLEILGRSQTWQRVDAP